MAKKANSKKRISREEARKLYPNEWVIFTEPRIDEETTTFLDGVVVWHGPDQRECYRRSAEIKADLAHFYMGDIPYRRVTLTEDQPAQHAEGKKVA